MISSTADASATPPTANLPMTSVPIVKIADGGLPHPERVSSGLGSASGGIYNMRRASLSRRRSNLSRHRTNQSRASSIGVGAVGTGGPGVTGRTLTGELSSSGDVEEGDDWQRGDKGHGKQVFRGKTLLWLAYQSIGVIYGDIGTSPLYVFSSTFSEEPAYQDLVQVLSVVLWSLAWVVTLKYVLIVLRADNDGEGGTFSCYSLLTRYAYIAQRDPREMVTVRMERALTGDMPPASRLLRAKIEASRFSRGLLKIIGVFAVSMIMSDGVLTPAQSVLGAVQGLNVVKPDISTATVVSATCGLLVVLFLAQPLGISRLAWGFAPVIMLWLAFNASFGIYNLVKYDWTVLRAFNPYYVFQFFIQHKTDAWRTLGGTLLAFTGVEALFADLGAFSMRAIQISWLGYVFPCLLLTYVGQAAFIARNPGAYENPVFNTVPPGMLYPTLVLAILAAIVASQAIITATFQLTSQISKLSYCPQLKVMHTSSTFLGQLYVPFLNWLLMVGTIVVTAAFSNTTSLGNAYGVCVAFVIFFDTSMVTLVAVLVWRIPLWLVALPWLAFACVDGLYLSSLLLKVPMGAWFTVTLASVLASLFLLWRYGKENQWRTEASDRIMPSQLLHRLDNDGSAEGTQQRETLVLTSRWGGDVLNLMHGFAVFFDKSGVLTPTVFTQFVTKFASAPEVSCFFHLRPVEVPMVPVDERYSVSHFTAVPGCYRLIIKHGFMDEILSPDLALLIYEQVRLFIIRQAYKDSDAQQEEEQEAQAEAEQPAPEQPAQAHQDEGVAAERGVLGQEEPAGDCDEKLRPAPMQSVGAGAEALERRENSSTTNCSSTTTNKPARLSQDAAAGVGGPIELRDEKVAQELARLDRAFATRLLYIVGKQEMRVRMDTWWGRRALLGVFLWIRDNTRAKIAHLRLAMDRVVEVGFVKEI